MELSSLGEYYFTRPNFEDRIQYFFIGKRPARILYEPPDIFKSKWLHSISFLPKSITQILNPLNWHIENAKNHISSNINFSILFDDYPLEEYKFLSEIPSRVLVVIFLNTQNEEIFKKIEALDRFFLVSSDKKEIYSKLQISKNLQSKLFQDKPMFFEKVLKFVIHELNTTPEILDSLKKNRLEQAENFIEDLDFTEFSNFAPVKVNAANIYQLLSLDKFDFLKLKIIEHKQRTESLLKSSLSLGTISQQLRLFKQPSTLFPTTIFVYPFFNPNHRDLFKEIINKVDEDIKPTAKRIRHFRFTEQDITNYNYELQIETENSNSDFEIANYAITQQQTYTLFLDFIGYLHSTFELSPYIRVPARGMSLNTYLSRLSPSQYKKTQNIRSLSRNLNQIGKSLSTNLPVEVVDFLEQYIDGIFAISDLPIEWLLVKGVPLAFLCDLCRVPETPLTSILSQFNINSRLFFKVQENILERTLVVCGADNTDEIFKNYHDILHQKSSKHLPCQSVHIQSKKDFFDVVNRVHPHLLIIDSHGDFNSQSEGSFIWLGEEKLTGDDIAINLPPIRLVILSCCWGTPIYGNSNTIAQAFFEKGSLSVVSTILPISVTQGFMLYFRILSNLSHVAKNGIHESWMNFISQTIRTSYLEDLLVPALDKYGFKVLDVQKYEKLRFDWVTKSFYRKFRHVAYQEAKDVLLKCIKDSYKEKVERFFNSSEPIPEFMLYTHLGRGDLIKFDSWIKNKEN